tara:strand:- start:110 stop:283 length:174 start_codon:yes stop_codon:yes gene_type:complete
MSDKDNQSEFDFDEEHVRKLRKVFGLKKRDKPRTDYEVFKEWHDNWLKEKKENKPPE